MAMHSTPRKRDEGWDIPEVRLRRNSSGQIRNPKLFSVVCHLSSDLDLPYGLEAALQEQQTERKRRERPGPKQQLRNKVNNRFPI